MIRFEGVTKAYRLMGGGRKVVLKGLTGEFPDLNIGILGGNGAGKSTLMRLIAGTNRPDRGRIIRRRRLSFPIGFSGSFAGALTGAENIRFVARIYGEDPASVTRFVEEFSELGPSMHEPVANYSSGMRARLAFGVSMAIPFEVYLVDEVLEVGDAQFRKRCREFFRNRVRQARMIVVSHAPGTLREYCQAGLLLKDGEATLYESIEDAITANTAAA
jgi:capsular polysaccharide transport system ATP-binding protein